MISKILKGAFVVVLVISFTTITHAQLGPGGGGPGGPGSGAPGQPGVPQDNSVPFDGGLSLILLAAGAGVGAKKRKMLNA